MKVHAYFLYLLGHVVREDGTKSRMGDVYFLVIGFFGEEVRNELEDWWNANMDNLMHFGLVNFGVAEDPLYGLEGTTEDISLKCTQVRGVWKPISSKMSPS